MLSTHKAQRPGINNSLVVLGAFALCLATALPVAAQRNFDAYPQRFTDRPLTLPSLHLSGDLSLVVFDFDGPDTVKFVFGGVRFGVTDDLEFGLGSSPIAPTFNGGGPAFGLGGAVAPDTNGLASPYIYGRYRLLRDDFQLGFELGGQLPTPDIDGGAVHFGMPLRAQIADGFALDAAAGLTVFIFEDFAGDRDTDLALTFTVSPRFGTREVYGGFDTGLQVFLLDPQLYVVPLGAELGGTLATGRSAVLDVYGRFLFPNFFLATDGDSEVVTEVWRLDVGVRVAFGFSG